MKKADAGPKPNPKPNSKSNRSILGITYVVVALFLGLAAYLGYFLQVKSEDVINNSYNARLDSFSDRIVRGIGRHGAGPDPDGRRGKRDKGVSLRGYL